MNTKLIQTLSDIDLAKILFLEPEINGEYITIPICYQADKKRPLLLEVPSLYLNDTYENTDLLMLPLMGRNDETTYLVNDFFRDLDNHIVDNIQKILINLKSKKLPDSLKLNSSDVSYKSIVIEVDDPDDIYKNGIIKYRFNSSTKLYDENKLLVDKENYCRHLVAGKYVRSIIEINSLIIKDNNVITHTRLHQLKLVPDKLEKVSLTDYSFTEIDQ